MAHFIGDSKLAKFKQGISRFLFTSLDWYADINLLSSALSPNQQASRHRLIASKRSGEIENKRDVGKMINC